MRVGDPGLFVLKRAIRAAIVLPVAFAIALVGLDLPQMALFAALGSMAMLVFIDLGGPSRARLGAYVVLALGGGVLIVVGTLCSRSTALASAATVLVAFGILFSAVLGGYVAAVQPAAILAYVLSVMVPAPAAAIPDRLAGWGLAAALSAAAALLLWPRRPRDELRARSARAARALADLVEASGDGERTEAAGSAREAVTDLYGHFVALPQRPSGSGGPSAALGRLIDDLGWLRRIAEQPPGAIRASAAFAAEREAIETAVPAVLRGAAARLDGAAATVERDLERLERARLALGETFLADVDRLAAGGDEPAATAALDEAFRLRQLGFRTHQAARRALQACGDAAPVDGSETARQRLDADGRLARVHASMRSVWFRNSLRGAIGLALAVLIGHVTGIEHAFWIALGTISVLRTNAVATGTTIVGALLGTLAGIVVGGALVAAIGDHEAALWVALPLAVLLAAYARNAVSFAAGQAAFTVVVLVLFNLIEPAGWRVGIARIEDVAIGCAVSLAVGVLVWPRGAASILRGSLGDAYRSAARYLDASIAALLGGDPVPAEAAREAREAGQLLDATARDYLSQRSASRARAADLSRLVAGATRVRRVASLLQSAHMLAPLRPIDDSLPRLSRARELFEADYRRRCAWYEALGESIASPSPPPEPEAVGEEGAAEPVPVLLDQAAPDGGLPPGLAIAWAERHVDTLRDLEPGLVEASGGLRGSD